jgi:hypothetical protein
MDGYRIGKVQLKIGRFKTENAKRTAQSIESMFKQNIRPSSNCSTEDEKAEHERPSLINIEGPSVCGLAQLNNDPIRLKGLPGLANFTFGRDF